MVADVRVLGAIGVVETTRPVIWQRCKNSLSNRVSGSGLLETDLPDAALYYSPATVAASDAAVNRAVQDETFFCQ